jgi:hypothetical protein
MMRLQRGYHMKEMKMKLETRKLAPGMQIGGMRRMLVLSLEESIWVTMISALPAERLALNLRFPLLLFSQFSSSDGSYGLIPIMSFRSHSLLVREQCHRVKAEDRCSISVESCDLG